MKVCRPADSVIAQGDVHLRAGFRSKTASAPGGLVGSWKVESSGAGGACEPTLVRGGVTTGCAGSSSLGGSFAGSGVSTGGGGSTAAGAGAGVGAAETGA